MDGQTLMNTPMDSPRFIVSKLIPTGLHILGGAPKIGKSWLVLWLCLQIANGESVWNYETRKGTTLYLCLEDSFERIQSRLYSITDDAPDNIHFAIMADTIGDGLSEQINYIAPFSRHCRGNRKRCAFYYSSLKRRIIKRCLRTFRHKSDCD
jgi:hypothetical protein